MAGEVTENNMADFNVAQAGTLSPEDYAQQQALNRQQKFAELLMAQGTQGQPAGQMVSGRYVPNSFFQNLLPAAQMMAGAYIGKQSDTKAAELAQKLRTQGNEDIYNVMTNLNGRPAQPSQELAGPANNGVAPSIQYPAVAPNPQAALQTALQSQSPQVKALIPALVQNQIPKKTDQLINYETYKAETPEGKRLSFTDWSDRNEKQKFEIDRQRLAIEQFNANKLSFSPIEGTSYALNSRTGEIVTLKDPVTGQPLAPKAPTHIQNEITAINQQKSVINGVIKNVEANPNAFGARQGFVEGLPMGGVIQNRKMTPEQVQARANVFNASSAVVKERAGTAQSPSEKETIMKFLPSPLDSSDVIINKMVGFNKYIEDKERGTTAVLGAVKPYIPNANSANPVANPVANPAAAPAAKPIYANNGKTRIMSTDGGNTWQPAGGQ